jgi:hypothetical protein
MTPPGYQPFHRTPPSGVGVSGEFYGTGDGGMCELTGLNPGFLYPHEQPACADARYGGVGVTGLHPPGHCWTYG